MKAAQMHLDDEEIQRLIHGEVPGDPTGVEKAHLASCEACSMRLASAREEEEQILHLLEALDAPTPRITSEGLMTRGRLSPPPWIRWAAMMVATLGLTTVAYAAPDSPVPGWMQAARSLLRAGPESPSPPLSLGGISIRPGDSLVVEFRAAPPPGVILVTMEEVEELRVELSAGDASFTSDPEHLIVRPIQPGTGFRVRIPVAAPLVEIRFEEKLLFLKAGDHVTTLAPRDQDGGYLLDPDMGGPVS